ncbi:MAG TPA: hypothetical protein VH307_15325 [Streptosporangiaceae bacterium]|nr:hypothetical protein [Streptosporangiaceae bacterium]
MTLQSPAPAPSPAGQPPGSVPAPPRRRAAGRLAAATTPTRLRILMIVLLLASLAWGAVGAWTVNQHASAAQDVVSTSEPLSLSAQQMYQSLSDADVTATTAFLTGPNPSLLARQRYAADIAQAAADLTSLKDAATTTSGQQLRASLDAVSTGLPMYTSDVAQAQTWYTLGYLLTGGSFMQVATEVMHLTLLPAARAIYSQENAGLVASSAGATGLPWIVVALVLALGIAFVLFRVQRWLWRHTHRRVNYGLVAASALLVIGALWLIVAFAVARADLQRGVGHGSTPAETLAQAAIDTQQIRGDEIINLISRSGAGTFVQDFRSVRGQLGPGPGTLLTDAAATSPSGEGAQWAAAAARDVQGWYGVNEQAYGLDKAAQYAQETRLVIGTGPGSSTAGFERVEGDLSRAIAADQVIFHGSATAGENAFTGLEAGIIVAALLMALGCAWGLSIRLAEYR